MLPPMIVPARMARNVPASISALPRDTTLPITNSSGFTWGLTLIFSSVHSSTGFPSTDRWILWGSIRPPTAW